MIDNTGHGSDSTGVPVEDAIRLATVIAKCASRGRSYRDDVVGEALLAVARGIHDRAGLEQVCRTAIEREWRYAERNLPITNDVTWRNAQHSELHEAMRYLSPRQRALLEMCFWEGMTTREVALRLQASHQFVSKCMAGAIVALRNNLTTVAKTQVSNAVVGCTR